MRHPRIPQHVYADKWEEHSQNEHQLMYEGMDGQMYDLHARALFAALAQGTYTDVRVRFPMDGDLQITIPREAVEQCYLHFIAWLRGEAVKVPPPASLLLQQEVLRQQLGLVIVPIEVWERWERQKQKEEDGNRTDQD